MDDQNLEPVDRHDGDRSATVNRPPATRTAGRRMHRRVVDECGDTVLEVLARRADHPATAERGAELVVAGELCSYSAGRICEELRAFLGSVRHVHIDVSDLTFIDAAGFRLIVQLDRDVQQRGGALWLHETSRSLDRFLELVGTNPFRSEHPAAPAVVASGILGSQPRQPDGPMATSIGARA
ncbi:MAG: hypothetical protein JWM12_1865 [Ilumatobacteraceae bacterium]|nr:hypothetical protein [Ilumatobacteraceae bacterium]